MIRAACLTSLVLAACAGGDDGDVVAVGVADLTIDVDDFDGATAIFALDGSADGPWSLALSGTEVASGDVSGSVIDAALVWDEVWSKTSAPPGSDTVDWELTGAVEGSGEDFPAPRRPVMALTAVKVVSYNAMDEIGTLRIDVTGTNEHESMIRYKNMAYTLTFDGTVVGPGSLDHLGNVYTGASGLMYWEFEQSYAALPEALVDVLRHKLTLDVALSADLAIETPWGDLPLSVALEEADVEVQ